MSNVKLLNGNKLLNTRPLPANYLWLKTTIDKAKKIIHPGWMKSFNFSMFDALLHKIVQIGLCRPVFSASSRLSTFVRKHFPEQYCIVTTFLMSPIVAFQKEENVSFAK